MNYAKLAFTEAIKKLQQAYGSRSNYEKMERFSDQEGLSPRETKLIEGRNSFYMASHGANDFPYIQHRGGPTGFLKVLNSQTLGFLDFSGNKQYITVGNAQTNNKVALILVDYPARARLKIYAELEVLSLEENPELTARLSLPDYKHRPERVILLHIKAFDWNCPQHLTPRFTQEEIEKAFAPQFEYIQYLEAEVKRLRDNQKN
ncbi:pyridoxamine 5'-phosphate oxidase family protein [Flexithrix dorotheae]|uniref:pyridoxamine 5'-phosphate oxidase family protein n=1 Tax=Flexithrix dorotheae TaxID=70993 RepID=UPI000367E5DC|nr:pyridoxamine 5'-phosphate oxidase family protein [Flexithrix dorotheae]